jgi:cytochrome c2
MSYLPQADGSGGGIQPLDDGRIFFANRQGEFGVIDTYGIASMLSFRIDMNLDILKQDPVGKLENFNYNWFRVTDINLTRMGPGRYELLVGHHYFQPEGKCIEMRLSRGAIQVSGSDISLTEPFRTVMTTKPCITINRPDYYLPFEGHFSGGRIARAGGNQVFFSTGDHGWVGLRGYPAVSQDDSSTLGKILSINLATNEVSIFAKGFRNPQGLLLDSKGRLWETEQGPRGGDELNLVVKDQNYGWPDSTYGTDYGPLPWPLNDEQGRHNRGILPQFAWNPSIAASNLIEVTGDEFPLWKGDLLVASLGTQTLHRLRLDGTRVVYDEPIHFEGHRIRDIIQFPSGRIAMYMDGGAIILLRNSDAYSKTPFLNVAQQQKRTADMSSQERAAAVAGRFANATAAEPKISKPLSAGAARGEVVFKANCATCHSLESSVSGIGPSLKGVLGRKVGTGPFAYSAALTGRNETWTSHHIVDFAVNPKSIYPGTVMLRVDLTPDFQRDLEVYFNEIGR